MSEKEQAEFDCPICNKGVIMGYFLHKYCLEDLKADLIELFNNLEGIEIPYNFIKNILDPFHKKYLGDD